MELLTRNRAPLAVLALVLLIPVGTSSLRGLTHILTCDEAIGTSITIVPGLEPGEPPVLLSAQTRDADDDPLVCGALDVQLSLADYDEDAGQVDLVVAVANRSELDWRGTSRLELGATAVPLSLGAIPAGELREERARISVGGEQFVIEGSLLLGP